MHYGNVRSWHVAALRKSSNPLLVIKGRPAEVRGTAVVVGPGRMIELDPAGSAEYCETTGNGISQTRAELAEIRQMMALQGLSMLVTESQQAETATAHRLDSAKQHSKLSAAAIGLRDCLETALKYAAQFLRLGEDAGGEVKVTTEFDVNQYDSAIGSLLLGLADSKHLTTKTLLKNLKERGILADTLDIDQEILDLEEESAGNMEIANQIMTGQLAQMTQRKAEEEPEPEEAAPVEKAA
jgi:hypothetical protein